MALSGSVNGGARNQAYLRIEWYASQNQAGNYSSVDAYLRLLTGNYYSVSSASFSMNVEGNVGSGSHPAGTQHGTNMNQLLLGYNTTINHNADGTRSFSISGSYNDAYFGTLTVGGTWQLDTIPRYANITSFAIANITDVGFNINISTDVTANRIEYTTNDGLSWTGQDGNFTALSIPITDQPSGKEFAIQARVRRASSGLWTTSPKLYISTLEQGRFFF